MQFGPWQVAPPSTGVWTVKRQSKEGAAWVRDDGSIAYFQAFRLPPTVGDPAFIAEVKHFTEKSMAGGARGRLVDSSYRKFPDRRYPCVIAAVIVDAGASSPTRPSSAANASNASPGMVQSRALVCRSNEEPTVGVFAGFSYPSPGVVVSLDAEAQAFFRGIALAPGPGRRWDR